MKRVNVFNIILELIVILGNIITGITILTYLFQHEYYNKILIGLVIISIGLMALTGFFALKFVLKMRSIQSAVADGLLAVLGLLFLIINIEMKQVCLVWGIASIALAVIHITTAILNLLRKPLICGVRIILNIILIVFSIFLLAKSVDYLDTFFTFIGIALLVEAAILLIEFIIARYQN